MTPGTPLSCSPVSTSGALEHPWGGNPGARRQALPDKNGRVQAGNGSQQLGVPIAITIERERIGGINDGVDTVATKHRDVDLHSSGRTSAHRTEPARYDFDRAVAGDARRRQARAA